MNHQDNPSYLGKDTHLDQWMPGTHSPNSGNTNVATVTNGEILLPSNPGAKKRYSRANVAHEVGQKASGKMSLSANELERIDLTQFREEIQECPRLRMSIWLTQRIPLFKPVAFLDASKPSGVSIKAPMSLNIALVTVLAGAGYGIYRVAT